MKKRSIEEVAREYARSLKVGFDADRGKRVGASEVGRCSRMIAAVKVGVTPDDGHVDENGFATRGNVMEDHWIAPLVRAWVEDHGGKLLYSGQADQVTFTGNGVPLSATPDGLAINVDRAILKPYGVPDIGKTGMWVPEFKSLDPRYGRSKLPKSAHVPQVITQMGMIRKATKYKPEWGAVAYVDASDYFDIKWFPVKWDESQFKSLVTRAKNILAAKDWNQFPPEGKIAGGSECTECPFAKRCLGFLPWIPGDDPRALKIEQVRKVEIAAAKVHEAEREVEKWKQAVRVAEANLYGVLSGVKRNFVMGKKYVVSAKATASQSRLDAKKLAAELVKLGGNPEKCRTPTKPGASLSVEMKN